MGSSDVDFHCLGNCSQQKHLLCDERFREKHFPSIKNNFSQRKKKKKKTPLIFSRNYHVEEDFVVNQHALKLLTFKYTFEISGGVAA